MKAIPVRGLLNDPEQVITVVETLEETEITHGGVTYPLLKPISVSGVLKPIGNGIIRFDGTASTAVSMNCARCLTPVDVPFEAEISQRFARPGKADTGSKNHQEEDFSLDELDAEPIDENDRIDLKDVILYEIKLSIPMRVLCKEDCKGLCPVCGKNLNEGSCSCKREEEDGRWDALKGLSFED